VRQIESRALGRLGRMRELDGAPRSAPSAHEHTAAAGPGRRGGTRPPAAPRRLRPVRQRVERGGRAAEVGELDPRALEAQPPEPADGRALVLRGLRAQDHEQDGGRLGHPDARQLGAAARITLRLPVASARWNRA
jgi:hypothetical protein